MRELFTAVDDLVKKVGTMSNELGGYKTEAFEGVPVSDTLYCRLRQRITEIHIQSGKVLDLLDRGRK